MLLQDMETIFIKKIKEKVEMKTKKLNKKFEKLTSNFLKKEYEKNKEKITKSGEITIKGWDLSSSLNYITENILFRNGTSFFFPANCHINVTISEITPVISLIENRLGDKSDISIFSNKSSKFYLDNSPMKYKEYKIFFENILECSIQDDDVKKIKEEIENNLSTLKPENRHIIIMDLSMFDKEISISKMIKKIFEKITEKYDVIFLFIQNVRDMDIYHEWCKAYFDSICRIKDEIIPSYVDYETYMFSIFNGRKTSYNSDEELDKDFDFDDWDDDDDEEWDENDEPEENMDATNEELKDELLHDYFGIEKKENPLEEMDVKDLKNSLISFLEETMHQTEDKDLWMNAKAIFTLFQDYLKERGKHYSSFKSFSMQLYYIVLKNHNYNYEKRFVVYETNAEGIGGKKVKHTLLFYGMNPEKTS